MSVIEKPQPRLRVIRLSLEPSTTRWLIPSLLALMLVLVAVVSRGFIEPYDESVHFLYAKVAFTKPEGLVSIWARLGCTAFYGLFANGGLLVARLASVLVTLSVCFGTTIIARHFLEHVAESFFLRHGTAWTWILLFAQPFFLLYSYTVMTEMLLAAVWTWTLVALIKRQHAPGRGILLAGAILGLGGLFRPEGWLAIAGWPLLASIWLRRDKQIFRRVCISTFLAILPTLGWYLLGLAVYKNPHWAMDCWPWSTVSIYGRTGRIFLLSLLGSMAVWLWIPIIVAIYSLLRPAANESQATAARNARQNALLLLALPLVSIYLLHGILGTFGLFNSFSLPRYFIIISPMAAVLGLLGLIHLETALRPGPARIFTIAVFLIPLLTHTALAYVGYLPTQKNLTTRRLDIAAEKIKRMIPSQQRDTRVIAGHPYLLYALDMHIDCPGDTRNYHANAYVQNAPPGTIVVIDETLWPGHPTPDMLESWGYAEDLEITRETDNLRPRLGAPNLNPENAQVRLWIRSPSFQPRTTDH